MTLKGLRNLLVLALLAAVVAGCSSTGARKRGGGYYKDDGPGANPPANIQAIPDAVPRVEPLARGANKPYVVFGKRYVPDTAERPFVQRGIASWYGKKFHGNATSIGEKYDMYAMTAAHPTLPIPSYARVTSAINGRSIIVRVNDRGPFHDGRIMDLSYVAAYKLGIIGPGSGEVTVQRILPAEINTMLARGPGAGAGSGTGDAVASAPALDAGNDMGADSIGEMAVAMAAPLPAPPAAATPVPLAPVPLAPVPATGASGAMPAGATPVPARGALMTQGSIFLQLGAFSQAANAEALAARVSAGLAAAGLPPATVEHANDFYRVRIGPYADRDAAAAALQAVSDRTGIQATIATR